MTDQNNAKEETTPVSYYGKKTYILNPMIARVKQPEKKVPDYGRENLNEEQKGFNKTY